MQVSPRERKVLGALVQLYIERREPISSRALEESADLGVRSASIRSVLGELERKGFLSQPHSNAGRVPTDEAYRAFVDQLLGQDLDPQPIQMAALDQALREAGEDLHTILQATARILGGFSSNIAILAGPAAAGLRITGVDLYERGSAKALVVVTLDNGSVRSELVDLPRPVPPDMLAAASVFLAERLAGRSLADTRRDLEKLLGGRRDRASDLAQDVARSARDLFDAEDILTWTFEGIPEALQQPEFGDPEGLKSLLQVLARSRELERVLASFVDREPGGVSVAIGHENPLVDLHPFALAAMRYEISGHHGYLAVLGPRRMQYARTLSLIRAIGRYLERLG